MNNVTFIIWAFVVLCAGCSSSTSVVQDEVSMTKKQLADKVKGGNTADGHQLLIVYLEDVAAAHGFAEYLFGDRKSVV